LDDCVFFGKKFAAMEKPNRDERAKAWRGKKWPDYMHTPVELRELAAAVSDYAETLALLAGEMQELKVGQVKVPTAAFNNSFAAYDEAIERMERRIKKDLPKTARSTALKFMARRKDRPLPRARRKLLGEES
jgi:hypothetical protein